MAAPFHFHPGYALIAFGAMVKFMSLQSQNLSLEQRVYDLENNMYRRVAALEKRDSESMPQAQLVALEKSTDPGK